MKKSILIVIIICWIASSPLPILAATQPTIVVSNNPKETDRVNALIQRLYELRATDKATLTRTERKELRKELREKKVEEGIMEEYIFQEQQSL